jgi:signal transduction histidine kinase
MRISSILTVGIESEQLEKQLEASGYGTVHVQNLESILSVEQPYSMVLIDESRLNGFDPDAAERLYFQNNSVPVAILIHNPDSIDENLKKILCEGTFEPVYAHEINNGFIGGIIDRIFIASQADGNIRLQQQSFREKENLERELNMRDKILTQERIINANIIGSITAGLVIIDNEGSIMLVNDHMRELTGIGDVLGVPYDSALSPEIVQVVKELLVENRNAFSTGTCRLKDKYLDISVFRMLDYQNKAGGMLLLTYDVTEREKNNIQLFRTEKLATVGTMLSGIAHELRNPLAIISARAQRGITGSQIDIEKIRKNFDSIEAQAQRCASIVNNLLDFTRHTATSSGRHIAAEILDETLTYVDYQNIFDDISVIKKYEPELMVWGDRSRYVQVFLNIITNAADAMNGRGTLTISASKNGPQHILVEINDTGPGIDPENGKKIFDPFFTTKETGKGTGLGLAIVFKIVQQSGGTVWHESKPGSTSFFIKLPSNRDNSDERKNTAG